MNSTATDHFRPRRLPVQWLDAPVIGPVLIRGAHAPSRVVFGASPNTLEDAPLFRLASPRPMRVRVRAIPGPSPCRGDLGAFTLLELMMVIAIIGFIAVLTLPHVRGYNQANTMSSAARQMLDDIALARQRAMVNRSTVYMVFLPPVFWTNQAYLNVAPNKQETNLLTHQYAAYALVTLASVGDQPGQHFPRYLTEWRTLPDGVFISPLEFTNPINVNIATTNTLSGTVITNYIQPWSTVNVPFPSMLPPNTANMPLPCIAFSPQGGLATQFTNQYIVLARGSIFYATDTNGAPLFQPPNLVETPPTNDINNPNVIQIDWMTARGTLFQNQLQ